MLCLAPQIQNPNCDSLTLGQLASYYILWEHLTPQLLQNAVISSVVDEYHPRPMEGVDRDRPFPYTISLTDPILLHESDDAIELLPVARSPGTASGSLRWELGKEEQQIKGCSEKVGFFQRSLVQGSRGLKTAPVVVVLSPGR
jgi:hypothetical protein